MLVSIEDIERVATTTLPKFLGRVGEPFNVVNEAGLQNYVAGILLRRIKLGVEGGMQLMWPLVFDSPSVTEWLHPYKKLSYGSAKPLRWGNAPWRALAWAWYIDQMEIDVNKGLKQVLVDILTQCKTQVAQSISDDLERCVLAPDGNYMHDGTGADNVMPFGLNYICTIDGHHVAEAGAVAAARSVFGLNCTTYPLHRHGYINPVGSSDGLGTITSIYDLPDALQRAFRAMRFDSVSAAWGQTIGQNGPAEDATDPDRPEKPADLRILCDDRTELLYRKVMAARMEDIGRDAYQPRPVFNQVEFGGTNLLRISSNGYGFDDAGNVLSISLLRSPTWPDPVADRGHQHEEPAEGEQLQGHVPACRVCELRQEGDEEQGGLGVEQRDDKPVGVRAAAGGRCRIVRGRLGRPG